MPLSEELTSEIQAAVESGPVTAEIKFEEKQEENKNNEIEEKQEDKPEISTEVSVEDTKKSQEGKDGVSDEVLTRAARVGINISDARKFPDNESLISICKSLEESQQKINRALQEELDKAFSSRSTQETEPEEDLLSEFDSIDKSDFEPEVVKLLETFANQIRAQDEQIKQLRSGQEYTTQASQQAAAREVETWFDKQVESLGPELQDTLGKGSYKSLSQGSSQLQLRDAIADKVAVLYAGHQALGRPVPPRDELFDLAASTVLADVYKKIEQKKVDEDLKKMGKQHLQRTGSSGEKTSTKTPTEEIAAMLDEKYFGKG